MFTTTTIFLLAALPLAQSPFAPAGEKAPPKLNRRILAPENAAAATPSGDPPARRNQPDDARLTDIAFVDRQQGWAVGDHGVILHTDDGGQHWSPQVSGVICTLSSVCFIDAHCGWAAGGMAYPYLHDSSGIVLSTRDGGVNWQREPSLLPAVRRIRFFSQRQGWAIACPSAMFPGGLFLTRDGGQSWQPAASGGAARLACGDFFDGRTAVLGGALGLTATITEGDFARNPHPGLILPGVNALQVIQPNYSWLVGDGGWIALTVNRGRAWQPPLGALPPVAALFDFSALAVRGPKCWIAGSPGSRIFFTPDAGKSWLAYPTGIHVPLRVITFADDLHGWAAGQLGTILATDDGGRTWRKQRSGGARAAAMAVAGMPQDLPLELLARVCKDQGYLGVAEVLGRADLEPNRQADVPLADRTHQALVQVGACAGETAWGFPVRHSDLMLPAATITEAWNRVHNGHGNDALLAHLVRQIRSWRPSVILTPASGNSGGLNQIVEQAVTVAAELARDPAFLTEQFTAAGCEPWHVQRVYLVSESKSSSKIALAADDWSSRLGQTWADAALGARALLADDCQTGPGLIGVQLISGNAGADATSAQSSDRPRLSDAMSRFDVMSGVAAGDGPSRRVLAQADSAYGGTLDSLAQGRQVQVLFEHVEHDPQAALGRLVQGGELPPGIDAATAAALTCRIAARLRQIGRRDLADKALTLLIARYPEDPFARWALAWRLQNMAASEKPIGEPAASVGERKEVDTPQNTPPSSGGPAHATQAEQALALAREIEINRPDLFASPAVRYPLAAVHRQLGQDAQAQRFYALDPRGADRDAWWACARGELWLSDRKGPSPKPLAKCVAAKERPHLDGRLDEPLWKTCSPLVLTSPLGDDQSWPATVMLAHDEQYLYLAIQCRQAPGVRYEFAGERRVRDPDLSKHDRVDIFLDLDRDYATFFQLTIDHRGWAADASCGDRSWDPKWFIAAEASGGAWTAEAAIPLAELKATITPGKTIWALGVQRTVPGVGFQSWTAPAAPTVVPEGFGWLEFE